MPAWITPELWPLWWVANSASFSTKAMVNSVCGMYLTMLPSTLIVTLRHPWVSVGELLGSGKTDDPTADDDNVERGVAAVAPSGCVPRPTIPVTRSVGQCSILQEDLPSLECSGGRVEDEFQHITLSRLSYHLVQKHILPD